MTRPTHLARDFDPRRGMIRLGLVIIIGFVALKYLLVAL